MCEDVTCVYVSNLPVDINRTVLRNYYSQFGEPTKCYLPVRDPNDPNTSKITKEWAKIYFQTSEEVQSAINGTNNDPHNNWKAGVHIDKLTANNSPAKVTRNSESDSVTRLQGISDFGDFPDEMDQYDVGCFLVEPIDGYVDVHGRPLFVVRDEMNEFYVPLREIRRTGFEIFREDNFNISLSDYRQKAKEFEMYLLAMGRQYLLSNKVSFSENDILDTLKRVEERLKTDAASGNSYESEFKKTHNFIESGGGNLTIVAKQPFAGSNGASPSNNRFPNNNSFSKENNSAGNQNSRRPGNTVPRNNSYNNTPSTSGFNQQPGRRNFNDNNRKFSDRKPSGKFAEHKSNDEGSSNGSVKSGGRSQNGFSNAPTTLRKPKMPDADAEIIPKLDQVKMDTGPEIVTVVVVDKQKENVYWVQLNRFVKSLDDVVKAISNANPEKLPAVKPVVNQYYLAEYEGEWHRAKVLKVTSKIQVHFVDYGNTHWVDIVKKLPDEIRSQPPALAVRIAVQRESVDSPPPQKLEECETVTVVQRRIFEDGTYGVLLECNKQTNFAQKVDKTPTETPKIDNTPKKDNTAPKIDEKDSVSTSNQTILKIDKKPEKPKEPTPVQATEHEQVFITGLPPPLMQLKHGDKIGIKGIDGACLLVVNKQSVIERRKLVEYISNLDKTKLNLRTVKENQMVLCALEGATGLYRAVVTKVNNNTVNVKYVDEAGDTVLSIKSLRNVDEYLSKHPACILTTPEIPVLRNISKSKARIEEIIANGTKMIVVMKDDVFDLEFQDKSSFCDEIRKLEAPPPETKKVEKNFDDFSDEELKNESSSVSAKEEQPKDIRILYSDMSFPEIVTGIDSFICQSLNGFDQFVIVATDETTQKYMTTVLETTVDDPTPYKPIQYEMCLALFLEDEGWYRAVVTEILPDKKYTVTFVDFGNEETVSEEQLRVMPAYLKEIPVLGIEAELVDIPRNDKVLDKLQEIFIINETKEVDVKEVSDSKIKVTVPEWYDILKSEGLI